MREVFKRIAVNGMLAAGILGVVGLMFSELADLWLVGSGGRPTDPQANENVKSTLRNHLPYSMAAWGFGFVAVGEWVLFARRRNRKPLTAPEPEPAKPVDPAEALLEELLSKAESAMAEPPREGAGQVAAVCEGEGIRNEEAARPRHASILTPGP